MYSAYSRSRHLYGQPEAHLDGDPSMSITGPILPSRVTLVALEVLKAYAFPTGQHYLKQLQKASIISRKSWVEFSQDLVDNWNQSILYVCFENSTLPAI
jgi:hypothetical protein